jgi:hypothetical protein
MAIEYKRPFNCSACAGPKGKNTWDNDPEVPGWGLILVESGTGLHRRVGFFQCRPRGHNACDHTFEALEERVRTILSYRFNFRGLIMPR